MPSSIPLFLLLALLGLSSGFFSSEGRNSDEKVDSDAEEFAFYFLNDAKNAVYKKDGIEKFFARDFIFQHCKGFNAYAAEAIKFLNTLPSETKIIASLNSAKSRGVHIFIHFYVSFHFKVLDSHPIEVILQVNKNSRRMDGGMVNNCDQLKDTLWRI